MTPIGTSIRPVADDTGRMRFSQPGLPAVRSLPIAVVGIGQSRADDDHSFHGQGYSLISETAPNVIAAHTANAVSPARTGDAATLTAALTATRARTLGLIAAWAQARPMLDAPQQAEFNLPLWELGHIGWFADWWIARNRQRSLGVTCEPFHARSTSRLPGADALYDSSAVAHATRWQLPWPYLDATLRYLEAVQNDTLALLQDAGNSDDALYFRLKAHFSQKQLVELGTVGAVCVGFGRLAATWDMTEDLPERFKAHGDKPVTPWGPDAWVTQRPKHAA